MSEPVNDAVVASHHYISIKLDHEAGRYVITSGTMEITNESDVTIKPGIPLNVPLNEPICVTLDGWRNYFAAWKCILDHVNEIYVRNQTQIAIHSRKRIYALLSRDSLHLNPLFMYDYKVGQVIVDADIWFKKYLAATIPESTLNNYPGSFWLFPSAVFGDYCKYDPETFYAFDFQLEVRYLSTSINDATDILSALEESAIQMEEDDNIQGLLNTVNINLKQAINTVPELIQLRDVYIAYMYVISPDARKRNHVLESRLFSVINQLFPTKPPIQLFRESVGIRGGILLAHNGDIEVNAIFVESSTAMQTSFSVKVDLSLNSANDLPRLFTSHIMPQRLIRNAQTRLIHSSLPDGYQMHHLPVNIIVWPTETDDEIHQKLLEVCSKEYLQQLRKQELANYQSALDEYSNMAAAVLSTISDVAIRTAQISVGLRRNIISTTRESSASGSSTSTPSVRVPSGAVVKERRILIVGKFFCMTMSCVRK
jgi:hypothetical protein